MIEKKWRVVNVEPVDQSGETYRIVREAGCELVLGRNAWEHPGDEYTEDELIDFCRGADAIIGGSRERFTKRLIESIPNLRVPIETWHRDGQNRYKNGNRERHHCCSHPC